MGGMSIGNLPSQSILKKINDIAADVNDLDLEGVNNLKSKLSELVAPELGNSDEKAISQKVVTKNIQRLNTEINNKISKVESAQNGNLPSFDNGNIQDSKIPVSNIAQQNGYYEGMVVGASRSLAGDNEVRAEYVFRPSGGTMDIGSGTASINRVLGKTLVWNQLVDGFALVGTNKIKFPMINGICQLRNSNSYMAGGNGIYNDDKGGIIVGHIYYIDISIDFIKKPENLSRFLVYVCSDNENKFTIDFDNTNRFKLIKAADYDRFCFLTGYTADNTKSDIFDIDVRLNIFDLTQMFGEGNEPATVEEFEAMFPNAYYEYNEGTLISNDAIGIKSVGFNAWDEELELGAISDGSNVNTNDKVRTKFIKVLPNTTYYVSSNRNTSASIFIAMYDNNKVFLKEKTAMYKGTEFTIDADVHYIKFYYYDTTLSNIYDICINLSHSGIRNGEYKPYEEHKLLFNKGNKLSAIKGKLNGEGESVVVFPDGLRSAGNVRDEIVGNVAIKRIGAVDMGTLEWIYQDAIKSFWHEAFRFPSFVGDKGTNLRTIKYTTQLYGTGANGRIDDKCIGGRYFLYDNSFYNRVYIQDTSYTDVTTFKQSLQGQILYYELAEPETYILDEAIPMNYVVDDWGTEQRLVADENEVLAPLCYDVTYAINAVDTIRNMPKNYISEETMQAFLSAVGSAMGGTWSMTWNEDMEKYVFTFAPNAVVTDVE